LTFTFLMGKPASEYDSVSPSADTLHTAGNDRAWCASSPTVIVSPSHIPTALTKYAATDTRTKIVATKQQIPIDNRLSITSLAFVNPR
jgi:hypothetical protein